MVGVGPVSKTGGVLCAWGSCPPPSSFWNVKRQGVAAAWKADGPTRLRFESAAFRVLVVRMVTSEGPIAGC